MYNKSMLNTEKGDTMNALEIITNKSKALANNIKTIENAGYTIKYAGDFKMFDDVDSGVTIVDTDDTELMTWTPKGYMFDDVDSGVTIVDTDDTELMTWTPKGYEVTFIFADNEGREIRIDTSLVSKTLLMKLKADEVGTFQMANIVAETERMNLDFLKVKTYLVEYSKGWESFNRTSFSNLEKQIEELSYF